MRGGPPVGFGWENLARFVRDRWIEDCRAVQLEAERRRALAEYNTGSVPLGAGVLLRALAEWFQPGLIVEIGTFVGMSSLCMVGEPSSGRRVFSCDKSNDCFQVGEGRTFAAKTPPGLKLWAKTGSTKMLRELAGTAALNGSIDLFFFDGRIQDPDLELIGQLAHRDTVYAFDDYEGNEKGVINFGKLMPWLEGQKRHHRARQLFYPAPASQTFGENTIAVYVPQDFVWGITGDAAP